MTTTASLTIIELINTPACELDDICDRIIDFADELTDADADAIMTAARAFDPTESNFAAAIRDTIRDNTDLDLR